MGKLYLRRFYKATGHKKAPQCGAKDMYLLPDREEYIGTAPFYGKREGPIIRFDLNFKVFEVGDLFSIDLSNNITRLQTGARGF